MMRIFSMKGKTKKKRIEQLADASYLHIPLHDYLNCNFEPLVKVGDKIKKYQLIGQTTNGFYTCIHAPVSGCVYDIKDVQYADGRVIPIIVLENDFMETEAEPVLQNPGHESYTPEQLLEIIAKSGVVGQGGAQFPTATKYAIGDNKINTFIINGTECEPYLTSDYALMAERSEELFKGIHIINRILHAEDIVITIEEQNKELQGIFAPLLKQKEYNRFRVVILPDEYPQGGELQLIKSVTGKELPRNIRPVETGIIVNNVGTVYAVYQAVANLRPVVSRIVTVSGEKAAIYGNYEVKIGTTVGHIIETLGLATNKNTVVLGGPMMGRATTDWSAPITKGTAGILIFKERELKRNNCISCGYCVDVCPMKLMPMKFEEYYRKEKYFSLERYSISSCIECAACEYICPSNVPLIESIKEGKSKLKQLADAIQ